MFSRLICSTRFSTNFVGIGASEIILIGIQDFHIHTYLNEPKFFS
jgi:hypothetical protein